jgi:hypothetical protein
MVNLSLFAHVIVAPDPGPKNNERMAEWAKDYWLTWCTHGMDKKPYIFL